MGADLVCRAAARGQAERRAAGRHHLGQAVLRDHQGREERRQGQAARRRWPRRSATRSRSTTPSAKVTEKKELNAAKAEAPPPPAASRAATAETKPDKKEPPKVDPIAETLKKEEAKKKAEERAKAKAAQQPPKPQPQFDPTKIAALLDKREPQRQAATGETLSPTPSLGKSDGRAAQLSQSEIDALRKRLGECWNPPAGAADGGQLKVVLRVLFKPDATVATPPQLVAATASPFGPAMAESAKRAILTCQPFTMLRPDHYEQWKDIEITFDPREMFGG